MPQHLAVGLALGCGAAADPAHRAVGPVHLEFLHPGLQRHARCVDAGHHRRAVCQVHTAQQAAGVGRQFVGAHAEQRHAALADVGEAAEAVVGALELEQRARHMRCDLAQPLGGRRSGGFRLQPARDVGLHTHHAQRRAISDPVDDAPALMQPAPAAIGRTGAVDVLVVIGLAGGMAQVGLVVGGEVVGVDQGVPVLLGATAGGGRVAELRKAFVDVAEPVAGDVPLPHHGAGAVQGRAHQGTAGGHLGHGQRLQVGLAALHQGGQGVGDDLQRGRRRHGQQVGTRMQAQAPQRCAQSAQWQGQRAVVCVAGLAAGRAVQPCTASAGLAQIGQQRGHRVGGVVTVEQGQQRTMRDGQHAVGWKQRDRGHRRRPSKRRGQCAWSFSPALSR